MTPQSAYLHFTLTNLRYLAERARKNAGDPEALGREAAMMDSLAIFERFAGEGSIDLQDPHWSGTDQETFFMYLKKVFSAIRTLAANSEHDNLDEDPRATMYVANLRFVLQSMQTSATSLGFDVVKTGMDSYSPHLDDLDRYRDR